jgi:MFS family permease
MAAGTALLVPTYLLLGYGHFSAFLPMIMMGVAFALVPAVMWPTVMLIVPQDRLGKAFGLMTMVQSIGLMGFNLLIGWVNDLAGAGRANPGGYRPGLWLFSASVLLGFGVAILLRRWETGARGPGTSAGGQAWAG